MLNFKDLITSNLVGKTFVNSSSMELNPDGELNLDYQPNINKKNTDYKIKRTKIIVNKDNDVMVRIYFDNIQYVDVYIDDNIVLSN